MLLVGAAVGVEPLRGIVLPGSVAPFAGAAATAAPSAGVRGRIRGTGWESTGWETTLALGGVRLW